MASKEIAADIRAWFTEVQNGTKTFQDVFKERVADNVEWTVTCPGDGPLGKTTPIAVDILVQPSENNDPSERHLTKAVVEWHGTGTLKKNGKGWDNYYALVFLIDNETKKAIRIRSYMDSAAVNIAFEE
ncbi:hypothetical protein FRB96_004830 [Tulasnella sp. 330]|nr:hypothetical protein FRB96_004830 [Tulasnella sp. 330]KAG8867328.1 hypothetical protein FRB98_004250 [Tulasnella sp. 332]